MAQDGRPQFSWQSEFDSMIARLFKDRLHLARHSSIVVARRGTSDRTEKLKDAANKAKVRFERKWGVVNPHAIEVSISQPDQHPGLQAIDYYNWALQRAFERGDFSMFSRYQNVYRVIVDVDDTRSRKTGAYFTAANPLTPEKIMPFEV